MSRIYKHTFYRVAVNVTMVVTFTPLSRPTGTTVLKAHATIPAWNIRSVKIPNL